MVKYIVEGWITYENLVREEFNTRQEANAYAEELANKYKDQSFNVSGPGDLIGLTDYHYKYDKYFKRAIIFCHND